MVTKKWVSSQDTDIRETLIRSWPSSQRGSEVFKRLKAGFESARVKRLTEFVNRKFAKVV